MPLIDIHNELRFPGMEFVEAQLTGLTLPPLHGDLVYIASDIGGEHKESSVTVYTALYAALYGSAEWELRRRSLRNRFIPDGRRISYKRLGSDNVRRRVLPYFLESASLIDGVLVSLVYDKRSKHYLTDASTIEFWKNNVGLRGNWKGKSFERLVRAANLASLLIGSLGRDGQNIYWISDNDAIFASAAHHADVARIMSGFGNLYIKHRPGELGLGTVSIDTGDRAEEDLVAVCDLVAGTLSEICTLQLEDGGRPVFSTSLSPKAQSIGSWMKSKDKRMQISTFILGDSPDGRFGVRCMEMSDSLILRP